VEGLSAFVEGSYVDIDSKSPGDEFRTDGLGDTRVLLRYTFTAFPHVHEDGEESGPLGLHFGDGRISLGAGVSFPTGDPERPVAGAGVPNSELQTGTGTYDPIVTAVYSQAIDQGSLFVGVAARIPGGENRFDYRVGEAIQANVGAVVPIHESIDFVPKLIYLYNAADELDGRKVFASGGHYISVVPGVRIAASERVDLEAALEIPVFRDLRTVSLEPTVRFSAGISVRF
jgi:hypothetical protein